MRLFLMTSAIVLATHAAHADVTLINVFEVPEGRREAVIEQWEAARDFLKEQPGYINTALHASIDGDARFELINVARWDSVEDFRLAATRLRDSEAYPTIEGLGINPALYQVVRSDCGTVRGGVPWMRRACGEKPWSN